MIMPKNVMCKKCNNLINGWCEKKIDSPDPNMVRDCQYFWEKTNADIIRAMNDEALSVFLWCFEREELARESDCILTRTQILNWLQSPVEEEGE